MRSEHSLELGRLKRVDRHLLQADDALFRAAVVRRTCYCKGTGRKIQSAQSRNGAGHALANKVIRSNWTKNNHNRNKQTCNSL